MSVLLWSFEGARNRAFDNFGGHSGGDTPLPIPNREVKPTCADGTRRATSRESRQPPITFEGPLERPFSFQAARSFSRQPGSSARRRRTRSETGGCVAKRA